MASSSMNFVLMCIVALFAAFAAAQTEGYCQ